MGTPTAGSPAKRPEGSFAQPHTPRPGDIVAAQRAFFRSGRTRDVSFRLEQLRALKAVILEHEDAILEACRADMRKPPLEAFTSERGMVLNEIDHALRNLRRWAKPRKVATPIHRTRLFGLVHHFPASSWIYSEPYGLALIIGPWNYPFQLLLCPLVGALAAGNCALVKPSEIAPESSHLIARMLGQALDPGLVSVVEGDADTARALLAERFDCVFFTGGTRVGTLVMEAAARHLTPVTLELGGKNPCIVDRDVPVARVARRIVWGKFFNAGQTCMTTDYLLVDARIKPRLLACIGETITQFYGQDPERSPDFARIVSEAHFDRLSRLLAEGEIVYGGAVNRAERYIAPTVIDQVLPHHAIMQEEVFGPILPVLEYGRLEEAVAFVNERPRPLALHFFSRDRRRQEKVLRETSAGGGCINETFVHEINASLPFGGVGASGIGKYHGRFSFETFSNRKGILKKSLLLDPGFRYPPYGDALRRLRRLL